MFFEELALVRVIKNYADGDGSILTHRFTEGSMGGRIVQLRLVRNLRFSCSASVFFLFLNVYFPDQELISECLESRKYEAQERIIVILFFSARIGYSLYEICIYQEMCFANYYTELRKKGI